MESNSPSRLTSPEPRFDPAAPVPEEYDIACEGCGYSLVGIQSDRCPECGKAFEPMDLPFARIPWLHRRKIGTLKAYLRTYRMIVYRPRQFAGELCRPVRISAADARHFRRVSIRIATLGVAGTTILLLGLAAVLLMPELRSMGGFSYRWFVIRGAGVVAISATFVLFANMFFRLATDLPVFIWKGHPSLKPTELAPIHCYAAAPLAIWIAAPWLSVCLSVAGYFVDLRHSDTLEIALIILLWALLGLWLIGLLATTVRLMLAAGIPRSRVWMMAAYLPVHWLIMSMLTLLCGGIVMSMESAALEWIIKHYS